MGDTVGVIVRVGVGVTVLGGVGVSALRVAVMVIVAVGVTVGAVGPPIWRMKFPLLDSKPSTKIAIFWPAASMIVT
jgi:hypothetical protein